MPSSSKWTHIATSTIPEARVRYNILREHMPAGFWNICRVMEREVHVFTGTTGRFNIQSSTPLNLEGAYESFNLEASNRTVAVYNIWPSEFVRRCAAKLRCFQSNGHSLCNGRVMRAMQHRSDRQCCQHPSCRRNHRERWPPLLKLSTS